MTNTEDVRYRVVLKLVPLRGEKIEQGVGISLGFFSRFQTSIPVREDPKPQGF